MKTRVLLSLPVLLMPALNARAIDVLYFDKTTKKDVLIKRADFDNSAEGLNIKKGTPPTGVKVTFPHKVTGFDVREVQFQEEDVKAVDFLSYRKPLARVDRAALPNVKEDERLKLLRESLPDFKELIPKLSAAPNLKRHVEFKYAQTLYRLSVTDETLRDTAAKALEQYSKDHQASWQIAPSLTMLAQLQEDLGDLEAMQRTFESFAGIPGVSEEIKANSLINAARVLMKTENFDAAQLKLQLVKLPPENPLSGKVAMYLSQCEIMGTNAAKASQAEQKLRTFLSKSEDKSLKALAHNTLGDYYAKLKRDDDAFWEYLRVDTLFSEDKLEHARAMYHLIRLFRDLKKDGDRTQSYEELLKDKKFEGMEYQKKVLKK